ncbi:MAG: hypothetical protein ACFFCP_18040 [Promethearchaeota archaeon]
MCRESATPTTPDPDGLRFLLRKTLVGWEEIRDGLSFVERLRKKGLNNHMRLEVYEYSENSNVKVTFRTVSELDGYQQSRFRSMLLEGLGESFKIEDIQRASDEIYSKFNEMNNIREKVIMN